MPNLSAFFEQFKRTRGEEKPGLFLGEFSALGSAVFGADFLSFVATKTGDFPTFEQWQKFLKSNHKTPSKPDRENPHLYQNAEYFGRDDLEARTYRAYIFTKKMEQYRQELHNNEQKQIKQRNIKNRYANNEGGYCRYIFDRMNAPEQKILESPIRFFIPEEKRKLHTYISGGTGSGKSEIMKSLIFHYLKHDKNTALVLIDPHGKIAQETVHFKENAGSDRIIYIAPDFDPTQSPIFNIFDSANTETPQALDIATQELIGAFREILQDIGFTPQMETLLKPCIATLLLYPEGNLYHLQQFMDKDENAELLAFALENLPNPAQRQFLENDFLKSAYAPSRQSIKTKIQSLLNSQIFLNFIIGKSSFSITEAIEQKKIIIFSLSRNSGAETSDTMGRLILASLQSLAMQRANLTGEELKNAPPIHLFIDECQHYITPSIETILTETRKYKLYLTLANQFLGQIEDRRTRNAIKGNTALKITGRQTETATLETIAKITGVEPEEIKGLKVGEYHIKAGELDSVKMAGNTELLDDSNAMTSEQWEALKAEQLAKYYRPISLDGGILQSVATEQVQGFKQKKKRGLN